MKTHSALTCSAIAMMVLLISFVPGKGSTTSDEFRNTITKEGLKTGIWTEETYGADEELLISTGHYNVISLADCDTIRSYRVSEFEVLYKGSRQRLTCENRKGDLISVKNGVWNTFDTTGRLHRTSLWSNGIHLWRKEFDSQGNLTDHYYKDFENDISYFLAYIDNQLFRKNYYLKSGEVTLYYPDNTLTIDNAEPRFRTNFLTKTTDTCRIRVTTAKDMDLVSIRKTTEYIRVVDEGFREIKFPLHMKAGDTLTLNMVCSPVASAFRKVDTLLIATSEEKTPPYRIYCTVRAAHLDGWNIETTESVTLSKSSDRYLIVAPMGSVTNAYIKSATVEEKSYSIQGCTSIDLKELEADTYELAVLSCNRYGRLRLVIVE